jgi:(p)ppGpp synthase/HD superfamily hydrolase
MDSIKRALDKAFELHKEQKRKSSETPYIVHIYDVAKYLLSEPDVSEEVIIAGILHDTLEDTCYTADELEKEFGREVLHLVKFATEPQQFATKSEQEKRRTWKIRKQTTVDACKTASREQLLLEIADKLSNLQSIKEDRIVLGEAVWSKFDASEDDIKWYYCSLKKIFCDTLQHSRMFKIYDKLVDEVFGGDG